jgi:CcmD family protein
MLLSKRLLHLCGAALLGLLVLASPVLAQDMPGQGLGAQSMQPYRFVFIAYAIAWLLVLGWIVSVARRLSRLSRRLED